MTIRPVPERLRPPVPPRVPPRPAFPVVAAAAPVLSSLVLFALTSSPYSLALAALGPVVAVASYVDGRRMRRRTTRAEAVRYAQELAVYESALAESSASDAAAQRRATPLPLDILEGTVASDVRWRRDSATLEVVLGRPRISEAEGAPPVGLGAAPLLVALSAGLGIAGPAVLTRAYVRGLLVQCAELAGPEALAIELPGGAAWDCLRALPHARSAQARVRLAVVVTSSPAEVGLGGDSVIAVAEHPADLPPTCRCVVQLGDASGDIVVGRVRTGMSERVTVDYVSAEQARVYSEGLAGSTGPGREQPLPSAVALAALGAFRRIGGEPGLPAVIGVTSSGPLELDLVRDGPHAIVGGTTGSGKSELLIAWILALAARHGPDAVTFLLADFKGGAGFAALAHLPHVTGVLTDLDPDGAARAFASIAAELRRREVVLAQHGVPDVARLHPGLLARLVIVVDECAVVLERAPELHRAFADITARGRSLGIHLVLCTQRPVGVVRDAVAANCGLRIALRVHDSVDSRTLVGSDAAARIPHGAAGRCVVSIGGRGRLAQAALAGPDDVAAATAPGDGGVPVHRPWLDPLPALVALPPRRRDGRVLLGLVDRPVEQRQDVVEWEGRSLLVLGASGSGRTGALLTIAEQLDDARVLTPVDAEEAWDAIVQDDGPGAPLLVDDLDLLLRRCSDDERRTLLDRLRTALRSGERRLVVSARRVTDGLAPLRDSFDAVLLLRAANRQEHQLLALDGEPFHADLPPGGGWWRGERLQVFASTSPRSSASVRSVVSPVPLGGPPMAVLSNRGSVVGRRLTDLGAAVVRPGDVGAGGVPAPGSVVVGSVTDWSSTRGLLEVLRRGGALVIDLPLGEARTILGPLPTAPLCIGDRVLVEREGRLERARWPTAASASQE